MSWPDTIRVRWLLLGLFAAVLAGPAALAVGVDIGSIPLVLLTGGTWLVWARARTDFRVSDLGASADLKPEAGIIAVASLAMALLAIAGITAVVAAFGIADDDVHEIMAEVRDTRRQVGPAFELGRLLAGVTIYPFVEEVLFRGVILHRWARKWGATVAIVLSSLAFGAMHLQGFVFAFASGVVLALVYLHTRNLVVPALCHAGSNLIELGLEALRIRPPVWWFHEDTVHYSAWFWGALAAFALALTIHLVIVIKHRGHFGRWPVCLTPTSGQMRPEDDRA